jgi:TolB-like protein
MLNSCGASIDKNTPLIVASLVSVDDLERSSSFGRMSAEIIANALAGRGYKIKELKLNQDRIFIRERGGEFALSRNVKEIARGHDVRFLVVGTYTMGGELKFKDYDGLLCCREAQKIYVSLRIVDASDGTIACAASYSVVTKAAQPGGDAFLFHWVIAVIRIRIEGSMPAALKKAAGVLTCTHPDGLNEPQGGRLGPSPAATALQNPQSSWPTALLRGAAGCPP